MVEAGFEIRDEAHYEEVMRRVTVIFDALPGTPEGDELDVLVTAVERYEDVHYPIPAPEPPTSTRDFRLELALLPPHLRSAACTAAGVACDPDWEGARASEAAFDAAAAAGRVSELEEAVRALADFEGLETVVFEVDDLDEPDGFPWFAGALFEDGAELPNEAPKAGESSDDEFSTEVLVSRLQVRSGTSRTAAMDWITTYVIPAYGMTAAEVVAKYGLGEMLDFLDALDAGVYA